MQNKTGSIQAFCSAKQILLIICQLQLLHCMFFLCRENREKGVDPSTPDKFQLCSTRSWVGQIKLWRRCLHLWDPPQAAVEELFPVSSQRYSNTLKTNRFPTNSIDVTDKFSLARNQLHKFEHIFESGSNCIS